MVASDPVNNYTRAAGCVTIALLTIYIAVAEEVQRIRWSPLLHKQAALRTKTTIPKIEGEDDEYLIPKPCGLWKNYNFEKIV